MSKYNSQAAKAAQLGMPIGTAMGRLRKMIMFQFVQKAGMDNCFRCGKKIETVHELSVEHKKTWLHSSDPVGLFFDLGNISFSHLKCNVKDGASHRKRPNRIPTSGYKGVFKGSKDHIKKPWYVSINNSSGEGCKGNNLGYFETPEEAAKEYDRRFLELGGPVELTNKGLGFLKME